MYVIGMRIEFYLSDTILIRYDNENLELRFKILGKNVHCTLIFGGRMRSEWNVPVHDAGCWFLVDATAYT